MAIIDKPSDYFETKLYTGNGGTQSITGLDFQPNWVWIKDRDDTYKHILVDSVRGATKHLASSLNAAEITNTANVTSFTSDGFALSSDGNVNANADKYASWNWKESATAGFDIVSYSGTGSAKTVSHNLGVKPDVIICKSRSGAEEWRVYSSYLGATKALRLNGTNAEDTDSGYWNNTEPTSSVFTVGTNGGTNGNGVTFIAYCFASVKGYSKFGSYTGNNNANGTFVYTGFKPAFVMIKRTSDTQGWVMWDNKRPGFNVTNQSLTANETSAEETGRIFDILSNGFKMRDTNTATNAASTYIYFVFAENPFVTSTDNGSIPATAR